MEYINLLKDVKKGKIQNIYLFSGQEQYLCEETISFIIETILNPTFKDLNCEYMEGDKITIPEIISACETLPFMDKWRIIIIKDLAYLQGKNR